MIRVSVVATGMDGASIAAIEPQLERRPMTAPPLRLPEARVAAAEATDAPAQSPGYAAPQPIRQPAPVFAAAEPAEEEQPDLYAAPVAAPTPAQPVVVRPVARIVDPAVAEAGDEPLFAEPAYEERRPRGGFLSIFGSRPRYDAPAPQAAQPRPMASRGGAQPVEVALPEEDVHQGEDLEIPSFLRRLAN
jgi:cell division protein FtsZ